MDAIIIPVDKIFLDQENPRHEPYQKQSDVIEYLCKHENILELARDIVKNGLNPLELFAVVPQKAKQSVYFVAEGNRRMCAIKLLNDPELAPVKLRKNFEQLAVGLSQIFEVSVVVFDDRKAVALWLNRIHGGLQGGIGRKSWSPEQKARHTKDTTNFLAQVILDYAENNGFILSQDRKGKLTTVQRYISNPLFRDAIGLIHNNTERVLRDRPLEDFNIILKNFILDLLSGTVNSRSNSKAIKNYSRTLSSLEGVSEQRIEPELLSPTEPHNSSGKTTRRVSPKQPSTPKLLPYEKEVFEQLKKLSNYKLEQIYYSICKVELNAHTPLLCVGVWAFIETLTAVAGRNAETDFYSFLSPDKLKQLGLGEKKDTKAIREAIKRIADYGNTTKHHATAAHFGDRQLYNDMDTIKRLICKLCNDTPKGASKL